MNSMNVLNLDEYFSVKDDLETISHDFKDRLLRLFVLKENKIKLLEDQIQDFKNKVKNQKSLQEFMDNFDTINKKLCDEIDSIKERNFLEVTSLKNNFDIKHKNLKTDILNKMIKFRNSTHQLIYKGTDLRYNVLKAENNKYLDELQYCSDAYEKIYYDNIALKHIIAKRNVALEEMKIQLNFIMQKYYSINKNSNIKLEFANFNFTINGLWVELNEPENEYATSEKKKNESLYSGIQNNDFNEKKLKLYKNNKYLAIKKQIEKQKEITNFNKSVLKDKIFSYGSNSLSISTNANNSSIDSKFGNFTIYPLFNSKMKTSSKSIFNSTSKDDSINYRVENNNETNHSLINNSQFNLTSNKFFNLKSLSFKTKSSYSKPKYLFTKI